MAERAVNNPGSYEHASFDNFFLNCLGEANEQCEGRSTYDQWGKFFSRATIVPRHFGLATQEFSTEACKKMWINSKEEPFATSEWPSRDA